LDPQVEWKVGEINKMLIVGLIFPIEEYECTNPIVIQDKITWERFYVYVDLCELNVACVCDPFSTTLNDEVLDHIVGKEAYSFIDGFSRYHQV